MEAGRGRGAHRVCACRAGSRATRLVPGRAPAPQPAGRASRARALARPKNPNLPPAGFPPTMTLARCASCLSRPRLRARRARAAAAASARAARRRACRARRRAGWRRCRRSPSSARPPRPATGARAWRVEGVLWWYAVIYSCVRVHVRVYMCICARACVPAGARSRHARPLQPPTGALPLRPPLPFTGAPVRCRRSLARTTTRTARCLTRRCGRRPRAPLARTARAVRGRSCARTLNQHHTHAPSPKPASWLPHRALSNLLPRRCTREPQARAPAFGAAPELGTHARTG